jgi:hypothetical protein
MSKSRSLVAFVAGLLSVLLFAGQAFAGACLTAKPTLTGLTRLVGLGESPLYFQANHNLVINNSLPLFTEVRLGTNGDLFTSGQWVAASADPGDGQDTIGLYRTDIDPSLVSTFYLADSNPPPATFDDQSPTPTVITFSNSFTLGAGIDAPIAGNWDGSGDKTDEVGLWRAASSLFILAAANNSDTTVSFLQLGGSSDTPLAGNWDGGDGNDTDEVGVARDEAGVLTFYLRDDSGTIYVQALGVTDDMALSGDWNGDGTDTIGIYRPSTNLFFMTNQDPTAQGAVGQVFALAGGITDDLPIVGGWAGNCPNN